MEFKELMRLLVPIIGIIFGLVLRTSNKEQFASVKKYWPFFVIAGALMFLFKLFKYLK
jgi:membrane protein CcdC involved in cytochrome C biogenesis